MRRAYVAVGLALVLAACNASPGAFTCFSDEECTRAGAEGHCEQTGFCSFADPACATGSRYGDYAGDGLGGRCVPEAGSVDDAGMPLPDAPPLPPCGSVGDVCCTSGAACLGTGACTGGICGCAALGTPSAGAYAHHTCEVAGDGTASCWGSNAQGQIGTGSAGGVQATPFAISTLTGVSMITTGTNHTCAIAAGSVWCWGDNEAGQCGTPGGDRPAPRQTSLAGATWIDAAGATSCAVAGSEVYCWGHNDFGQVGDGSTEDRNRPKKVPGLTGVVSVSSGVNTTCARKDDDTAWCWGAGNEGELGVGQAMSSLVPVQVGLTNIAQIVSGDDQVCARTTSGLVFCWGDNEWGVIGDGTTTRRLEPTQVVGLTEVLEIDVADEFACARKSDGTVWCWGQNDVGQLGTGTTSLFEPLPRQVLGLTDAVAIAAGADHACARRALGAIICWGSNVDAQLGDGSTAAQPEPELVRSTCP
jgi:alpha-tubulin suppressor-like RCC1 family protein